jgi:hypothetical protein
MNKSKLVNVLGILGALSLPAVVVAQQFTPNTVLSAQALQELAGRVAALENNQGVGAASIVSAFGPNEIGSKTFRATGDGIMTVRASGGGFQSASVDVSLPIGTVGRMREGGSATVPLRQNEIVTVESNVSIGGTVALFWFPLNGDSSLE